MQRPFTRNTATATAVMAATTNPSTSRLSGNQLATVSCDMFITLFALADTNRRRRLRTAPTRLTLTR